MNRYWFRPKTYGYGATPATWEGWTLSGVYTVSVLGVVYAASRGDVQTPFTSVTTTLATVSIVTALFIYVSWRKTDGVWKWRSRTNFNGKSE